MTQAKKAVPLRAFRKRADGALRDAQRMLGLK